MDRFIKSSQGADDYLRFLPFKGGILVRWCCRRLCRLIVWACDKVIAVSEC